MQSVDMMFEPVRAFLAQVGVFLPRVMLALLVLGAGWLVAKLARLAIEKALRAINFHVLTERAGIDGFLRQGGMQTDSVSIFGTRCRNGCSSIAPKFAHQASVSALLIRM